MRIWALVFLLAGCRRPPISEEAASDRLVVDASPGAALPTVVDDGGADASTADAATVATAPPTPAPTRGAARLVIEHVEAVCIAAVTPNGGANGTRSFTVGEDLLLELVDPESAPKREHVYCAKHQADGTESKPRLGVWRNCRRDPSCKVVATEAERSTVQCGSETVTLEVRDGRTILRGSFGERVIAPHPMTIEKIKRERRNAAVDC